MSQVGSTCYSSDAAAVSSIASAESGKVVPAGATVYVIGAVPGSDRSITYTLSPIGGGTPLIHTATVDVQPCQLLDWSDGMALGWAVAGVWLLVAAVLHLREVAHS